MFIKTWPSPLTEDVYDFLTIPTLKHVHFVGDVLHLNFLVLSLDFSNKNTHGAGSS